jgi:hypothetical protein
MITIWTYADTRYRVGHPDHIEAFANPETQGRGFKADDPEGIAFEYQIIKRTARPKETAPAR